MIGIVKLHDLTTSKKSISNTYCNNMLWRIIPIGRSKGFKRWLEVNLDKNDSNPLNSSIKVLDL